MSDHRSASVAAYVSSSSYSHDLDATRATWSGDQVLPGAGIVIFLSYLTAANLMQVRRGSERRVVLDITGERLFLARLLGLIPHSDDAYFGGIANPRVAELAGSLGTAHRSMTGMLQQYMDDMAAVVAVAPIRVIELDHPLEASHAATQAYWRYATAALSLLGADLASYPDARDRYERFALEECAAGSGRDESIEHLRDRYPDHFECALRAVPQTVRDTALAALACCR